MFQNAHQYQAEKMIRIRQQELDKNIRAGLNVKEIHSHKAMVTRLNAEPLRIWQKWFGKRRLDTSLK